MLIAGVRNFMKSADARTDSHDFRCDQIQVAGVIARFVLSAVANPDCIRGRLAIAGVLLGSL
jgi:hypothetical protein